MPLAFMWEDFLVAGNPFTFVKSIRKGKSQIYLFIFVRQKVTEKLLNY